METLLAFASELFGNLPLLFCVECCAIAVKGYLIIGLSRSEADPRQTHTRAFLMFVLGGAIAEDLSWIAKLVQLIFIPDLTYSVVTLFIRIAWAFLAIRSQAIGLLLESLTEPKFKLRWYQFILAAITATIAIHYISFIFFHFAVSSSTEKTLLEYALMRLSAYYFFISVIPSLLLALYRIRSQNLPRIIKRQIAILVQSIIVPLLLLELLQLCNTFTPHIITNAYATVGFSTSLLTYAIYYSARRIMNIRFLNLSTQVRSSNYLSVVDNFKEIAGQLSAVSSTHELAHLVKAFFMQTFKIPTGRTNVYFTSTQILSAHPISAQHTHTMCPHALVEHFFAQHERHSHALAYLRSNKVIIRDELEFNNFYSNRESTKQLAGLLIAINADIFVALYRGEQLAGYIIVEHDARQNELYTDIERDQMAVFASFVSNVIHLVQNHTLESLLAHERELKEELYRKHQEVNQYKESIRSFLSSDGYKKIGIIFYKHHKWFFGNQNAQELVPINPNIQAGHPLAKSLKHIAQQVQFYKVPQTHMARDDKGNRLVLTGVLNLEASHVIVIVYHPDISDIIRKQIDLLKDPSEWDYLLYLETTQSGKFVNTLVPGSSKTIINLKIQILKCALSRKALLLQMPEEDLAPTIEIIHQIGLRDNLHVLNLQTTPAAGNLAIRLFGINPIFGASIEQPLLEKLGNNSTLFIQNINFMDLETQIALANFIKYGYYQPYKSDQRIASDVRIICSTTYDLTTLVSEGRFDPQLHSLLSRELLNLPSLLTIPEDELGDLADECATQAIGQEDIKSLLELSDTEKKRLIDKKVVSLHEFKNQVSRILTNKSRKNTITQETHFDPAYNMSDPSLIEAARLGKHALKDKHIMSMLWSKFKNQNKIATFLSVNRSSVNRRCKEFNLR